MTTVGEILKNKRLEGKITLEQVEKATKIRTKFLAWIEDNQFGKFSSPITTRGFVKNYAIFLGLPLSEIMAFYRRQAEEKLILLPKEPPKTRRLRLTPQLFTGFIIGILFLQFFSFLGYQYFQFSSAPSLTVTAPVENTIANRDETDIIGKTDPQASVSINNQPIRTEENGSFQIKFPLSPGLNTITIKASNKYQKTTTVTRHLRLEIP